MNIIVCFRSSQEPLQEPRKNATQISSEQVDEFKCDNCHKKQFYFFCKQCDEYLCISCNYLLHRRGKVVLHDRFKVNHRQRSKISICCKVHGDHEVRWYCSTCHHCICEHCFDRNGAHRKHDLVLCHTIANELKSKVSAKYLEVAESKKEPIINALRTLQAMLYEIGVEGVPMFRNAISMEDKYVDMELKSVREIDELAKAKSDAVMKQIKALNTSLNKIANSCDAKEAMIASPVLEACVRYSDVVALLDDLEAHMASIKIAMDSSILATVCTFDVLRVLEKSCHMGGPSTPRHVLIEEADIKDEKC